MPCCKAGDLILWDSRTIHCNTPSMLPKEEINLSKSEIMRLVAYVCMTPKSFATPETLSTRAKLFQYNQGTTHWPHFISISTSFSEKEIVNDLDSISSEQKELIGL